MKDKEIFSTKFTKGKRTYFFDIKKSEQGDLYLKISESKKTENGFEHHRLMVFDEDMKDFVDTLRKTLAKFKEVKAYEPTDDKAYSVEKVRQLHKQAYSPWTAEDDSKLELLFCEGKNFFFAKAKSQRNLHKSSDEKKEQSIHGLRNLNCERNMESNPHSTRYHLFERSVCKLGTESLRARSRAAANIRLNEIFCSGGEEVLLMNFCGLSNGGASNKRYRFNPPHKKLR